MVGWAQDTKLPSVPNAGGPCTSAHVDYRNPGKACQSRAVSDDEATPPAHEEKAAATNDDVVMVHSPTEDGQGYHVLRMREGNVELGAIRNIREGAPIHGDIVRLSPHPEHASLFNVEVLVKSPRAPEPPRSGPAQVATDAYRTNWEQIFGGRDRSGNDAPN